MDDELIEVVVVARVGQFALRAAEKLGTLGCRALIVDSVVTAREAVAHGGVRPQLVLIEPVVWLLEEEPVRRFLQKLGVPTGMLCMGSNGQVGFIPAGQRSGYTLLTDVLEEIRTRPVEALEPLFG